MRSCAVTLFGLSVFASTANTAVVEFAQSPEAALEIVHAQSRTQDPNGIPVLPQSVLPSVTSSAVRASVGSSDSALYGAFWEVGPTSNTEIVLRPSSGVRTANLVLYGPDGTSLASTVVQLSRSYPTSINLSTLLPLDGHIRQGALMLQWTGSGPALEARVVLNREGGIEASYLPSTGLNQDTGNTMFAPWYLPGAGSSARLALFNSSNQGTQVRVSVMASGSPRQIGSVELSPLAANVLDLRSMLNAAGLPNVKSGSVLLEYTGTPHALQSELLLSDISTGFAAMPEFLAPSADGGNAGKTDWQFPEVRVAGGSLQAHSGSFVLLSNPEATAINVTLRAYSMDDWREVHQELPSVELKPYETKIVSLDEQVRQNHFEHSLGRIGLTVEHSGQAGRVGVHVFTNARGGKTLVTLHGLVVPAGAAQVVLWNAEQRHEGASYRIKTQGGAAMPTVTLYYETPWGVHSYSFPAGMVTPGSPRARIKPSMPATRRMDSADNVPQGTLGGMLILSKSPISSTTLMASQPRCSGQCSQAGTMLLPVAQPEDETFDGADPPQPCVSFNGGQCQHTQSITVSVGQRIVLAGYIPSLKYIYYGSQSWDWDTPGAPSDRAVGCNSSFNTSGTGPYATTCQNSGDIMTASNSSGFNPGNYQLPNKNNPNGSADATGSLYTLWFVYPPGTSSSGTQTLYFNYTATDGASPPTPASVTITVNAIPTAGFAGTSGSPSISVFTACGSYPQQDWLRFGQENGPRPECGPATYSGYQGESFQTSGSGTYEWVQLINSRNLSFSASNTVTCHVSSGLDTIYPYATGTSTSDLPGTALISGASATDAFDATMFLLWQPSGSASIWVPASTLEWTYTISATWNPSAPGNTDGWVAGGGGGGPSSSTTTSTSSPSMGYPAWSNIATKTCP